MVKSKKINFLKLARNAAKIADDKKGEDIVLLSVRRLTTLADYFVIATAGSVVQMKAIADTIEKAFNEVPGIRPVHKEGVHSSSWAVLDYGGLVVHIMTPLTRTLYALERIWSQARKLNLTKVKKFKVKKK